jgi:hypothetical protein
MRGGLYNWAAKHFFGLYKAITREDLPEAASSFRLYSRRALNAFLDNRDRYELFPVVASFAGYGYSELPYDAMQGGPSPQKADLAEALRRGTRILLVSSHRPLRLLSMLALTGAFLNVLYSLYVFTIRLWRDQVAEGWTSLSLQVSLMFFLLFLIVAALCEYVVRLFLHGQERPRYVISGESHSMVLARKHELNVKADSETR